MAILKKNKFKYKYIIIDEYQDILLNRIELIKITQNFIFKNPYQISKNLKSKKEISIQ